MKLGSIERWSTGLLYALPPTDVKSLHTTEAGIIFALQLSDWINRLRRIPIVRVLHLVNPFHPRQFTDTEKSFEYWEKLNVMKV